MSLSRHQLDQAAFRRRLLGWYRKHRRGMPWRSEPGALADPYAVLVSETMLQQTQVATVVAYYKRFMAMFPTVQALALADEQRVLHAWQGLGYYRRARFLHRAARQILDHHHATVPHAIGELRKLPGVGRYTAGAVASIAFGKPEPVVDGNVARVLGRVMGLRRPVDSKSAVDLLWRTMGGLVNVKRREGRSGPGDVNQAAMELGATVCAPVSPRCERCPVRELCKAFVSGSPQQFGNKAERKNPRSVTHYALAVANKGRWLLEQRPDTGLWAGMWQVPTFEAPSLAGEKPDAAVTQWAREKGLKLRRIKPLASFTHATTHRLITFRVLLAGTAAQPDKKGIGCWRLLDDMADLPMSNAQKRVLHIIRSKGEKKRRNLAVTETV